MHDPIRFEDADVLSHGRKLESSENHATFSHSQEVNCHNGKSLKAGVSLIKHF